MLKIGDKVLVDVRNNNKNIKGTIITKFSDNDPRFGLIVFLDKPVGWALNDHRYAGYCIPYDYYKIKEPRFWVIRQSIDGSLSYNTRQITNLLEIE